MGRGQYIRDFKRWPRGKPLSPTGKIVFYDPDTDSEYGLTPDQLAGASAELPQGVYDLLEALETRIAELETARGPVDPPPVDPPPVDQPPVALPVPEAPTVATLDQNSLTGSFQVPAGTTLDQLEIELTPAAAQGSVDQTPVDQTPVVLPMPEAPTVGAFNQDSLTGQFQVPAGTTLDQLEIDVTPATAT